MSPMSLPTLDAAMTVELGRRVVLELMTEADWGGVLNRMAHWMDIDAELPEVWESPLERWKVQDGHLAKLASAFK